MAKSLTAAAVERLKPDPDRRLEVPDGLLPGLYLVIQPTGKKSWAVRYRADGKPKKLTLGTYPGFELDEARDAARAAMRDAQKGADPAADKQIARALAREKKQADRDTVEALGRLFIERYAKPKNRGWREQARLIGLVPDPAAPAAAEDPRAFILSPDGPLQRWQGRRVEEIAKRDVITYLDTVIDRGSPVAANRILTAIRKMFQWAVERDAIDLNPAAGVRPPTAETHRDRVLSDAELKAIWTAAGGLGYPFGPMVRLLMLTAQRRDEVAGMSYREIDDKTANWSIPRERAKNDTGHDVPLSSAVLEILASLPKVPGDRRLVFTTNGETPVSGFSRAKTRLDEAVLAILRKEAAERGEEAAAVTMADWRLHDLRRTAATGMARLGIDLPVIEKVLNHLSGSFGGIVGVYQRHTFADEKRRALEAWGSFVTTLVTDQPKGNVSPIRRAAK